MIFLILQLKTLYFFGAEISNSDFNRGEIIDCHFENCDIEESTFIDKTLEGMDIDDAVSVKFVGGEFVEGKIEISSTSGVPYFICTDLTGTNFNFGDDLDDGIDINKYFKSCYYKKGQRPLAELDASREYESVCEMDVFVESDKPWSEQPVDEWVDWEIAKLKLKRAEEAGEDTAEQKSVLAKAEKALQKAQERLRKPPNPKSPPQH